VERRWIVRPTEDRADAGIAWQEICGLPCIAELLKRKGFASTEEVNAFLQPRLSSLSDPFLLPNMDAAVARILRAIENRERVVLFGDYDVDGVTSIALLWEILCCYGLSPNWFLPLRLEEGYGLSRESVDRCCEQYRPQLLIAVDCGTSSVAEIGALRALGVDVIVLDHHEPKFALPNCVALVNPKIDPNGPFHYLCSVGLAFKLCHALIKKKPVNFDLKRSLELVALGTVADLVPLESENRTFVQRGMFEIGRSKRPGIRKLMEVASVRGAVAAEDIAFRLGPRLNAAGRLTTAEKALQLLLTRDETEANELALLLDAQNRERRSVEKDLCAEAETELAARFDPDNDASIVVGARDWHPGVLGIVAARLARKYHRPTVVVGFDSSGVGKGSGRSIEGFSLVDALGSCQDLLEKFGGHEMAAGLTVREESFPAFIKAFGEIARQRLTAEALRPRLHLDHELFFTELNEDLLHWHQVLEPFGTGNRTPLFFARAVEPVVAPAVLKDKHLVLRLRQKHHVRRAIFFDGASSPLPPPPWDMAFRLNRDTYNGEVSLQIQVEALRRSAPII
jgi:single-stranded-DNA-specific exonuclease